MVINFLLFTAVTRLGAHMFVQFDYAAILHASNRKAKSFFNNEITRIRCFLFLHGSYIILLHIYFAQL